MIYLNGDDDCEKCADQARMKEITEKIEEQNKKVSCSLCSTKIGDGNRIVSDEEMKTLSEIMESEGFKSLYQTIAKFSKQLNETILSSEAFMTKMLELYQDLKKMDMLKDNGKVVGKLRDMMNYAQMVEVDAKIMQTTIEMILGKVHGNG